MNQPLRDANGIEWEHTPCPGCGADDPVVEMPVEDVTDVVPVAVVRCGACDLNYLEPRPTPETVGRLYPDDYVCYHANVARRSRRWREAVEQSHLRVAFDHPGPVGWGDRLRSLLAPLFVRRRLQKTEWIRYRGAGRLLDVGCGSGEFLKRMQRRGWNVEGLDISPDHCARISVEVGVPVHTGLLPGADVEEAAYDVVTFWQVLEHVHDPVATLSAARSLLAPGGSVVAASPNFGSWSRTRFGREWIGLDPPRHLIHYTPETFAGVFERAGFRVVRVIDVAMDGWIRQSAGDHLARDRSCRRYTNKPVASATAWWSERVGRADNLLIEAVADTAAATEPVRRAA